MQTNTASRSSTARRGDLIVCVDDEAPILASLRRLLKDEPYEVLTTERPEEALGWVSARDVSLIVADYRMPQMNGIDLLLAVQERSPTTQRIMLTGYPGDSGVRQGEDQGLLYLFAKPWNSEELKRAIRSRLRERRRLEEQMSRRAHRERQKIAQDLHDTLGQDLAGIALLCKALEEKLCTRGAPEGAAAKNVTRLVLGAITKARALARGLMSPAAIDERDLAGHLMALTSTVQEGFGVECGLDWDPRIEVLRKATATHLYWILHEALTNAVRHGKPRGIRIKARLDGASLRVSVVDDGKGLPVAGTSSGGIGLHIMRSRAEAIDASLTVERRPEGGTRVTCEIPEDSWKDAEGEPR